MMPIAKSEWSEKMSKRVIVPIVAIIVVAVTAVGIWFFSQPSEQELITVAIDLAWSDATREDDPDYLKEIGKRSSYKVVSVTEENGLFVVDVLVAGVEMSAELEQLQQEDFPQDEQAINKYLAEVIERCPIVETETVVYATPSEDGYQITFSDDFVDAMSGKIYSYYMEKVEEYMGGA